jgi:hypothetical protein
MIRDYALEVEHPPCVSPAAFMSLASPVAAIRYWRNSAAAAVPIRSRVFAASILDFLIVSHLLNGAGAGKLPMALDI